MKRAIPETIAGNFRGTQLVDVEEGLEDQGHMRISMELQKMGCKQENLMEKCGRITNSKMPYGSIGVKC